MLRRPTSYDVAQLAAVSQATVSYVLNGKKGVTISDETRMRVLRAARQLGYRSNNLARALIRGKSQTLGVIMPQINTEYDAAIIQGIHRASTEHGYKVLIGYSEHDPELGARQVDMLLEHQVDGMIWIADEGFVAGMPKWLDIMHRESLYGQLACVIVDERSYASRVDSVVTDDVAGAMSAVNHLIALGHRRIGHLGAGTRMSTSRDRLTGYLAAMQQASLAVEDRYVASGSYFQEQGALAAQRLMDSSDITAVFAASDLLGLLVREEAMRRGRRLPSDLALVSYGNTELAAPLRLTTVDQKPCGLGQRATERLLRRLSEPDLAPEEIMVEATLMVRESCGAGQDPLAGAVGHRFDARAVGVFEGDLS